MYYVFIYEDGEYSQYSVPFKTEEEAVKFEMGMAGYAKRHGVSFHIFKQIS